MAASDCSPVTFLRTFDNAFYFQVETAEGIALESDAFKATEPRNNKQCWVRSKENKTLLLNNEHFEAQNLNRGQQHQSDCHFKFQTFSELQGGRKGTPTMLYVTVNNEKMVVCCRENHDVYPKKMNIPQNIAGNKSEAIFYMNNHESSGWYEFESSEFKGHYLGFKPTASDSSIIQLALHPKGESEVVDACVVVLETIP